MGEFLQYGCSAVASFFLNILWKTSTLNVMDDIYLYFSSCSNQDIEVISVTGTKLTRFTLFSKSQG